MTKNETPTFSIIIPVYNKAQYIIDTLSSILNQTYQKYEVVMIGGKSTDDSDKICNTFAQKYPDRFKYIIETGNGISGARNDGILYSTGKYIAFLDADDIWDSMYLETMKKLIDDFPCAVFYASGHDRKYPDGKIMGTTLPINRGYNNYFTISTEYNGLGIITSWIIYNKTKLLDIGLFNTKFIINEDADLATRMALSGKFAYEPKTLGVYLADLPNTASKKTGFEMPIPGDNELSSIEQTPDIIRYHEYWIQRIAQDNILRGYRKLGRQQLNRININYKSRKIILTILSYLPTNLALNLKKYYNKYIWRNTNNKVS